MQPTEYQTIDDGSVRASLVRGLLVIATAIAVGAFVLSQGLDDVTVEAVASADEGGAALGATGELLGDDDGAAGSEDPDPVAEEPGGAGTMGTVGSETSMTTVATEPVADTTSSSAVEQPAEPGVRAPAEVPVLVLNGVGTKGIAADGVTVLKNAGYDVLAPRNATTLGPSEVLYLEGFEAEAQAVATVFGADPAAVVVPYDPADPPFDDIRNAMVIVVLGQDGVIAP